MGCIIVKLKKLPYPFPLLSRITTGVTLTLTGISMRLSKFISKNVEVILKEWEDFVYHFATAEFRQQVATER